MTSVAVLGSGIGGLFASNYLLQKKNELEVTIFEKTDTPGGRAKSVIFDDLSFDIGPTIIAPIFIRSLKKSFDLDISCFDVTWDTIAGSDRMPLRIDNTMQSMRDLNNIHPLDPYTLTKILIRLVPELQRLNKITVKDLFDRLKLPRRIRLMLTAATINVGLPTVDLEASALKLLKYAKNFKYPIGGIQSISNQLAKYFEDLGGTIKYHSTISKIDEVGEKVQIHFSDGSETQFDYAISNLGVKRTVQSFINSLQYDLMKTKRKIKYSTPTIQTTHFLYSLKGSLKNFKGRAPLINYYPQDSVQTIDAYIGSLYLDKPYKPTGFYLNFPALYDRSLVRNNTVPISFQVNSTKNPSSIEIEEMQDFIEAEVDRYLITDFTKNAKLLKILLPKDFINIYGDPGYTAPISTKLNYPHFDEKLTDRIYLAGTGAGERLGPSVIQASRSGLIAAKRLLKSI